MESAAAVASNTTAKLFAQVAKRFLGTIKESTFTCSFLKGVVKLS
jgi:hypothetical protein